MYALGHGRKKVVELLVSHEGKLDANAVDDTGKTALHWSCKRMRAEVVSGSFSPGGGFVSDFAAATSSLLVNSAASVALDISDKFGNTPLMYAAMRNSVELVRLLLGCLTQSILDAGQLRRVVDRVG